MIQALVYCPEPCVGCPPNTKSECGELKTVTWASDSTNSQFFYLDNINLRVLGFRFAPISNNGSQITVNILYYVGSDYITAETFSLGTLPTTVTKYHYINLGPTLPSNTFIQVQVITTNGTSGELSVELDCDVNVGSRLFCYISPTGNPNNLCPGCLTQIRVYYEQTIPTQSLFRYNNWFVDATLETPAPPGYYRLFGDTSGQIYFFDGTNARENNNCECSEITCPSTITLNHVKAGYKYSTPYIPGLDDYPKSTLKYSVKCFTTSFKTTDYGYVTVTFTANGSREDVGFTVQDVNMANGGVGFLSFSSSTTGKIFNPITNATLIRPPKGQNSITVNILLNTNDSAKTSALVFRGFVGQKTKYKSNATVTTQFTVSCLTPIYKYTMGLHTYSAFDSYYNPKLTTDVYSYTPISSWTNGTLLFNDSYMAHPAMPWYYGYTGTTKVYKVGVQFDRSFGTQKKYKVKSNLARQFTKWIGLSKQSYKVDTIIEGPKKWEGVDEYHVPACIEPEMDPGYIKFIYNWNTEIPEPSKYEYLIGTGTTQVSANDSVFSLYDFGTGQFEPSTGFIHATSKLTNGYLSQINQDLIGTGFNLKGTEMSAFVAAGLGVAISSISIGVTVKVLKMAAYTSIKMALECPPIITGSVSASATLGPVGAIIIAAIIVGFLLYALFKTTTTIIEEQCKEFIKVFTDSPYIELNESIYARPNFTQRQDGRYIVDGAYYYFTNVSTGLVTTKQLSYTIIDGVYKYSILPDVPRKVTEIPKLFFLPYTSGDPIEFITVPTTYYSIANSVTVLPNNVGELNNPLPITYSLPSGFTQSYISQEDANEIALTYLSGLTANTQSSWTSYQEKPGISGCSITFTHELKIENPPATFDVAYNNSDNNGITINKKLYYDINGFYSVLDGYYSIETNDVNSFKKFYQTSAGTVIDIYTMSSSTANTVQSQQTSTIYPLETNFTGYTSSWYFTSPVPEDTYYHQLNNLFNFNNIWNTSEFYSNSIVRRGFTSTPITLREIYLYDSNTSLSTYQISSSAYFKEIPEVFNQEPFYYSTGDTIFIDFEQYCADDNTNGVNIICKNEEGDEMATFVGVSFAFMVELWLNDEGTNTTVFYEATILPNESRIFFELPISYINNIVSMDVTAVFGQNPNYNFFFTGGTFTTCTAPTPTPSPVDFTPTPLPDPSVTPTSSFTPTPTITPTQTPTETITQTPTPTVTTTTGGIPCDDYYNNTDSPYNGINYVDCDNISYTNVTVESGQNICVQQGTLNGGDSGFLINLGNCGIYYPVTPTPTPTETLSPTTTPTPTNTATNTQTPTVTPTPGACYNYILGPNTFSITYQYTDCTTGNITNQFVSANTTFGPVCSSTSPTGGFFTKGSICGTAPSPTPTPTKTMTPTASSVDLYVYYNSTSYSCSACGGLPTGSAILRFTSTPLYAWYSDGLTSYQIGSSTSGPEDVNGDALAFGSSCSAACIT